MQKLIPRALITFALAGGLSACAGAPADPEEAAAAMPEPEEEEAGSTTEALAEVPDLEDLLSAREFREAGLDQLDDEQLAALNEALSRHLGEEDTGANGDSEDEESRYMREARDSFGLHHEHPIAQEVEKVESRISGTVAELEPGARLELENGHVWEVVESRTVRMSPSLEDPEVIVHRGWFGSFRMQFEDRNQTVTVRRIE